MVRRFHSLVARRFKDWGEGGTEFQGVQHARFLKVYLKSAQIRRYPSAAWVREFWMRQSPALAAGADVWRIEFSWDSRRLHEFDSVDPNALWAESLRLVRLTARRPSADRTPLRDLPAARVWRQLQELQFDAPWSVTPHVLPPIRLTERERRRRAVSMIAGYAAWLIDGTGSDVAKAVDEARAVFDALVLDDEFVAKLVKAIRQRSSQRGDPNEYLLELANPTSASVLSC